MATRKYTGAIKMTNFNLFKTCSAIAIAVGATFVCLPTAAFAQSWTGAVNDDYNNGANWSTGTAPPPSGTVVTINTTTNAPVVDGVAASASSGIVVGDGGAAAGRLTVRNGGQLIGIGQTNIGGSSTGTAGGDGTVLVTGSGSLLQGTNQIFVAATQNARGTLTIDNGGTVRGNAGAFGAGEGSVATVTVRGANSLLDLTNGLLNLGSNNVDAGRATLNILAGGRVTGGNGTTNFVNAVSAINISGANSLLSSGAGLTINGSLLIEDGGALNYAQGIAIGGAATLRNGTITAAGSSGLGIVAGGALVADGSTITAGAQFNVTGAATLRGSALSAPIIGISQNGVLNIGGAVGETAGVAGTITSQSISVGEPNSRLVFNHTGPDLVVAATIGGNGRILHRAGTTILTAANPGGSSITGIDLTDGTLFSNGNLRATNMTVSGGATLGGTGIVEASVVVTDGIITPGFRGVGNLTLGNLTLTAASVLNFELGAPGTPGVGSDLLTLGTINTAGNLTLDGTLNVASVGGFGAGLYRLINYRGTLTNNGLVVGTTPAGFAASDLTVQTSVASQVNLLVGTPPPVFNSFSFWDGANTIANNVIDGGSGTWTATARNFTVSTGEANGVYDPAQLLIFAGTGGLVTVDNSAGDIFLGTGAQFAANGYRVTGGAVRLDAAATTIRVGDGTAAGSSFGATIDSVLAGTGGLLQTDLGTLVLTAANTYTGGTEVAGGTLRGNTVSLRGPVNLGANGTVQFDQNSAGAFAGTLSGTGTLRSTGTGILSVVGTSSMFGGSTLVEAGTLNVTGTLSGAGGLLTVRAPAALTGNGTVSSLDVAGRIAPGSGAATLTVQGGVTFRAGSTYSVDLAAAGGGDRIAASGSAVLQGGTVVVTTLDPDTSYRDGSVYRILDAAGGRAGTFAGLTETSAFLDFLLGYDANGASITIRQIRTFPDVARTYNQTQAATALRELDQTAGSDALAVYNAILLLDDDSARAAFDASSGEIYASLISARQRQGMALASQFALRGHAALDEGFGIWGGVTGHSGHVAGDGNGAHFKSDGFGGEIGLDYRGNGNAWALGIGGGWQYGQVDASGRASQVDADEWHIGGYARLGTGAKGFTALATLLHAQSDANIARTISFGPIMRNTLADAKVRTTAASIDLRYGVGEGHWSFGPAVGVMHSNTHLAAFSETGASALNLFASENNDAWTRYSTGVFAHMINARGYVDIAVRYVTGKRNDADVDLNMTASSQTFNIRAPVGAKSGAQVQLSGRYDLGSNWALSGQTGAIRGGGNFDVNGSLSVSFQF